MFKRYCVPVFLGAIFSLSACSGNYKFSDDEYRPLGDPQAVNRNN